MFKNNRDVAFSQDGAAVTTTNIPAGTGYNFNQRKAYLIFCPTVCDSFTFRRLIIYDSYQASKFQSGTLAAQFYSGYTNILTYFKMEEFEGDTLTDFMTGQPVFFKLFGSYSTGPVWSRLNDIHEELESLVTCPDILNYND